LRSLRGGAFLLGGSILFFTALHPAGKEPPPATTAFAVVPSLGPGGGGMLLKGAF
jgi:hypothetical protein